MKFIVVEPFESSGSYYIPFGAERPAAPVKANKGGDELKIDDSGEIDLSPKDAATLLSGGSIVKPTTFRVLRPIEHDEVIYVPEDHDMRGFAARKNGTGAVTGYEGRSYSHGGKLQVDSTGKIDLTAQAAEPLLSSGAIEAMGRKKKR